MESLEPGVLFTGLRKGTRKAVFPHDKHFSALS